MNNILSTLATAVFLLFPTLGFSQIDESVSPHPFIALVHEYDVTVNDDYTYDEVYHSRIRVNEEDVKDLGQWPVYYNKSREQILSIKAYVESADGKKVEAKQIEDDALYPEAPAFDDMRVKVIKLPTVMAGQIIDVTIKSKTLTKEIPLSFWHMVPLPVIPTDLARYQYSFPQSLNVQFKSYATDIKPVITKSNDRVNYLITLKKAKGIPNEDYSLPEEDILGAMSFSTISDWGEIARWFKESVQKAIVDDADISVKSLELVAPFKTPKEKLKAILEFVSDNFKYVAISPGDHGVSLHETKDVFKRQYGDAKDLTILIKQMLGIAGIDANICLFSGEFNGDPQHKLPNPNVFDHLILQVNLDGKWVYVDPQAKGFDLGQFPSSYDNAYVMVLDDRGFHFDQLPVSSEDINGIESRNEVKIEADGSATFEVTMTLPIEQSVQFKEQWAGSTSEQQDKFFEQMQSQVTPGGKILNRQITGVKDRYGQVTLNFTYQVPRIYPLVNNMILLKEPDQSHLSDLQDENRETPLFFPTQMRVHHVNVYHIPEGYEVDFLPESYELKSDFMETIVKYRRDENVVTVDALYRTKRMRVPVNRYNEIKAFRANLLNKNEQYVVLKRSSSLSKETKEWIKKQ